MKKWLKRIGLFLATIVGLVALALGWAVWTTTPPTTFAPEPPGAVVVSAPEGEVSVGIAAVDVTPDPAKETLYLAGFQLNRKATGVHDPLFARALALERGDVRVVFVVLDAIGIQHHHAERVRARLSGKVRPECLVVLATHVHSAPDTMGLWGPHPLRSGISEAFLERALDGAAEAAEKALATMKPARLTLARGQAPPKVSKNKRDPDVIDREVLVVAADDAKTGAPIGTAIVFACHPEVLFGENTLITADFPGVLLREVERKRGGTAIFLNGPLGGMVTPDVAAHSFEECERVGKALAEVALGALASGETRVVEKAPLAWAHRPIAVPIQNRRFIGARRIGVLDRPFEGDGYVRSEVHALALGPLGLATVPGEALPRVGFDVKEGMRGLPWNAVITLASDELGYVIPEDAFSDPARYKYEKTVSPGPLATTLIRRTALEAIAEVTSRR